jgi:hypothetical protein
MHLGCDDADGLSARDAMCARNRNLKLENVPLSSAVAGFVGRLPLTPPIADPARFARPNLNPRVEGLSVEGIGVSANQLGWNGNISNGYMPLRRVDRHHRNRGIGLGFHRNRFELRGGSERFR